MRLEMKEHEGTIDSLCGNNHDPSFRHFAKQCWLSGYISGQYAEKQKVELLLKVVTEYNGLKDSVPQAVEYIREQMEDDDD